MSLFAVLPVAALLGWLAARRGLALMLQIALYFALLSLVSVGGIPSVMPEMQRMVVDVQGWMSAAEYTQLFAIAQAAPGPNVLVTALIGWKVAGLAGGLVALGAFCGPAAALAYSIGGFWDRMRDAPWRKAFQRALVPITRRLHRLGRLRARHAAGPDWQSALIAGVARGDALRRPSSIRSGSSPAAACSAISFSELEAAMSGPVYALNLFNVADRDEYLAYSRRSAKEVQAHGGKVVALGKFREAAAGDIKPRNVLILVEWTSKEAFDGYCRRPEDRRPAPAPRKGRRRLHLAPVRQARGPAADPYRLAPAAASAWRSSRSFAFARRALSLPMRTMIFCPADASSRAGSANS